jgi:hypothetical protein
VFLFKDFEISGSYSNDSAEYITVFWNVTPFSSHMFYDVSEEPDTSVFRVAKIVILNRQFNKQVLRNWSKSLLDMNVQFVLRNLLSQTVSYVIRYEFNFKLM